MKRAAIYGRVGIDKAEADCQLEMQRRLIHDEYVGAKKRRTREAEEMKAVTRQIAELPLQAQWKRLNVKPRKITDVQCTNASRFQMMNAAGVELSRLSARTQLIDFNKRQKRQNRSFRRIEVHGGYTDPQRHAVGAV
jgi:hypothetical protein